MKVKSIVLLIIITLIMALGTSTTYAAGYEINATNESVEVGDSVTINVSFTAAAWNVTVSGDKISGGSYASQTSDLSEVTTNKSFTLDTSEAGNYSVSITGDITDENGNTIDVSKTISITVKAKEEPTTPSGNNDNEEQSGNNEETKTEDKKEEEKKFSVEFTEASGTVYTKVDSLNFRSVETGEVIEGIEKAGTELEVTGVSDDKTRVKYNGNVGYVASEYVTSTKPEEKKNEEKSKNANLKSLSIEGFELKPEFKASTISYAIEVGNDINEITVKAETEDSKAKVDISGNKSFKEGDNKVTVKVTAEDGTTKSYEINVTKTKAVTLGLKSLKIKDTDMSSKFKTDVFSYKINVKDVDKLEIEAVPTIDTASVEILGNENLQDGENTITIMVKSEDGKETKTYQIIANKNAAAAEATSTETTSNNGGLDSRVYLYGGISLLALILLIILIVFLIKNKRKHDDDPDDGNLYNYDRENGKDKDEFKNEFGNDFNEPYKDKYSKFEDKNDYKDEYKNDFSNDYQEEKIEDFEEKVPEEEVKEPEVEKDDYDFNKQEELENDIKKQFGSLYGENDDNDNDERPRRRGKHF